MDSRRRAIMGIKKDDYAIGTLKYWWCGKDTRLWEKWESKND